MAEAILIMPAVALGLVIGIYEILIIHRDVRIPAHRFSHGLHALVVALVAVFASVNVEFIYTLFPALKNTFLANVLYFRIAIGLIMAVKIHGVSAALKTAGMRTAGTSETWFHSLLVGALVAVAPYILPFIIPSLPSWLQK